VTRKSVKGLKKVRKDLTPQMQNIGGVIGEDKKSNFNDLSSILILPEDVED
jgi:hypothetical protein